MKESQLKYYEKIGDWNFEGIKCVTERIIEWDFHKEIKKNTNDKSLCLDLGTGGGEEVLKNYPEVGMVIGTDFSKEMLKTANKNLENYPEKRVKFAYMNSLKMSFPEETFDLISARHTVINAKQIYNCLRKEGVLVIEGVDQKDCWDLKELFGKGQGYNDTIAISEKDYLDLKEAGFENIEKVEILENEYYKTKEDLMALLIKAPILDDFSEIKKNKYAHIEKIDEKLFNQYVQKNTTEKGILLKRVLYGIVARK